MKKTTGWLADGREIIYYDPEGTHRQPADDPRPLDRTDEASTLRYDALLDEWVALAGHRQERTYLPPGDQCPLCPSRPGWHTEIPDESYEVVVFENRFPSLSPVGAQQLAAAGGGAAGNPIEDIDRPLPGSGVFAERPGAGRCEVVCYSSDHDASFADLSPARARLVMDAWADRTAELHRQPYVEQVFCFENRGEEIGVSLNHPHGQIYAYPYVTPTSRRMLASAESLWRRDGRNLFGEVLNAELRDGRRLVAGNEHWVAFVPYAARWPLEVHLYPRRHTGLLPELGDDERDAFGELYLDMLRRMQTLHGRSLPYIAAWHQRPARVPPGMWWLHLRITSPRRAPGKLKYLAGSESAMGAFVNDLHPDAVAAILREAQ